VQDDSTRALTGPAWLLLVLDRDPVDPVWLIATVADPADVRPMINELDEPSEQTRAWVASRAAHPNVTLTPLSSARCWRLDGR
jgi:hypothetical protein